MLASLADLVRTFHLYWRWVVVLLLVLATAYGLYGWLAKRAWDSLSAWLRRATPIAFDIQVTLGLLLYVLEKYWTKGGTDPFRAYVHPLLMLVALGLLHMFLARGRPTEPDAARYRWMALGAATALLLAWAGGALPVRMFPPAV